MTSEFSVSHAIAGTFACPSVLIGIYEVYSIGSSGPWTIAYFCNTRESTASTIFMNTNSVVSNTSERFKLSDYGITEVICVSTSTSLRPPTVLLLV